MNFVEALLIFVLIDLAILCYVFYFRRKRGFSSSEKKFFEQKWRAVVNEHDHHKAILNADKLLDLALQKKGYAGSLGEKLKKSAKLFSSIDHVWFAHKLRNRVAHEISIEIKLQERLKALRSFEQALKDLGLL
jgi:hypothetical protein